MMGAKGNRTLGPEIVMMTVMRVMERDITLKQALIAMTIVGVAVAVAKEYGTDQRNCLHVGEPCACGG